MTLILSEGQLLVGLERDASYIRQLRNALFSPIFKFIFIARQNIS